MLFTGNTLGGFEIERELERRSCMVRILMGTGLGLTLAGMLCVAVLETQRISIHWTKKQRFIKVNGHELRILPRRS